MKGVNPSPITDPASKKPAQDVANAGSGDEKSSMACGNTVRRGQAREVGVRDIQGHGGQEVPGQSRHEQSEPGAHHKVFI